VFFEQHVAAYWLAQLLVRSVPPILIDTAVAEVHFQTEHLGWQTDDFLIVCERLGASGRVGKAQRAHAVLPCGMYTDVAGLPRRPHERDLMRPQKNPSSIANIGISQQSAIPTDSIPRGHAALCTRWAESLQARRAWAGTPLR